MWYSLTGTLSPYKVDDAIGFITHELNRGSKLPLTLYISTIGGAFYEGLRLYDFLKSIPITVETVTFSGLDVAGLLAFLAGEKRIAISNCLFEVYVGIYHVKPDEVPLHYHQRRLEATKIVDDKIIRIIAEETGKTSEEIEKMYQTGKTFSAEEARDFGITHIVTDTFPVYTPPKKPEEPIKN